jgi:hypothetical protein
LREAADKERGAKELATRLREAADKERKEESRAKTRYHHEKLPSNDYFRLLRLSAGHVGNISCTIVSFDIFSEFLPEYRP